MRDTVSRSGLLALAALLVFVAACSNASRGEPATPTVADTATPTVSPTVTADPTGTPSPTPTPFDGAVATLQIPRFDVVSSVEPIGLKPGTNQLDTPANPHDTGWYDIYDRPGWGGNAVFSAHVDYWPDILGPFNKLDEMEVGDTVIVDMANGAEYVYEVIDRERYDADTIPMGDIIWPPNRPAGEEWITLITCGGELNPACAGGPCEYLQRDVVVARRVQ